jgi:hypothetical protein
MIQVNFTTFELDSRTKEWIERVLRSFLPESRSVFALPSMASAGVYFWCH